MGTGRLWIGGVGKQGMTGYQQGYKQGCILCDIGANLLGYNPAFTYLVMASTSQPIALPSSSHNADYAMAEGSYTGSSGMFNPASYTRHFLGSPISWLAGSFGVGSFGGGRFPMGSPTAQLLSSIEYVTLLTRLPPY